MVSAADRMAAGPLDDLNLTDPTFFSGGDPHALWADLRRRDPVHCTKSRLGRDFWSITKHADVQHVFMHHELFSSRLTGATIPPSMEATDPAKSEHARLQQSGAMLVTSDPPRHGQVRRAIEKPFFPRSVNERANQVRALAGRLLDAALDKGECDFVKDVAGPLPLTVIFEMMNIPQADRADLFRCANMHATPDDPDFSIGTPMETRAMGLGTMTRYCREAALERRGCPSTDVLTMLGDTQIEGEFLTDDEIGFNGQLFIVGGQETTRNSLSRGIWEIARHPGLLERLRSDPSLLKTAPEEILRWASPISHNMRTATQDTEIGGKLIRQGEWVVLWIPSANRDETVFADPFRFDLGRKPNPHVAFGYGPHFCLGAFLARLELRVMLELFVEKVASVELLGEPQKVQSIIFSGFKTMPVRLKRR
jgi:cholest-4-en-3-one 26-monooxygenase